MNLAHAEQGQRATRERLIRLLGVWGDQTAFELPERLPDLPKVPEDRPDIEPAAMAQRLDVAAAKLFAEQTAKNLGLTKATRFINVLEVGYLDNSSKSPTCGCCKDWIVHLQANGFRTVVNDTGITTMRGRLGIDLKYGSCHTARIAGYAIEGHVPAADIRRLLKERPKAIGLAVPGMPVGSPGMDGPEYNGRKDSYDVLLVAVDGKASIFQPYR